MWVLPYPAGYVFPLPFGGWPSLFGRSCARSGVGPRLRLVYRWYGPERGCHVPHMEDTMDEDALYTPGSWCPNIPINRGYVFEYGSIDHIPVDPICRLS